ncbi:hypothetical protein Tco_0008512 [Tanacetum coccineum]
MRASPPVQIFVRRPLANVSSAADLGPVPGSRSLGCSPRWFPPTPALPGCLGLRGPVLRPVTWAVFGVAVWFPRTWPVGLWQWWALVEEGAPRGDCVGLGSAGGSGGGGPRMWESSRDPRRGRGLGGPGAGAGLPCRFSPWPVSGTVLPGQLHGGVPCLRAARAFSSCSGARGRRAHSAAALERGLVDFRAVRSLRIPGARTVVLGVYAGYSQCFLSLDGPSEALFPALFGDALPGTVGRSSCYVIVLLGASCMSGCSGTEAGLVLDLLAPWPVPACTLHWPVASALASLQLVSFSSCCGGRRVAAARRLQCRPPGIGSDEFRACGLQHDLASCSLCCPGGSGLLPLPLVGPLVSALWLFEWRLEWVQTRRIVEPALVAEGATSLSSWLREFELGRFELAWVVTLAAVSELCVKCVWRGRRGCLYLPVGSPWTPRVSGANPFPARLMNGCPSLPRVCGLRESTASPRRRVRRLYRTPVRGPVCGVLHRPLWLLLFPSLGVSIAALPSVASSVCSPSLLGRGLCSGSRALLDTSSFLVGVCGGLAGQSPGRRGASRGGSAMSDAGASLSLGLGSHAVPFGPG